MGVNQDHHVIRKTRVLHMGVSSAPRRGSRLLQHSVYLVEIKITENGRNHSALRDSFPPRRLQDQVEKPHHLCLLDPSSYLLQQQIMLNAVEVGSEIKI